MIFTPNKRLEMKRREMKRRAFLDYYEEYKIIPVNQNITDIKKHFRRRNALYRILGIPRGFVKDKSVIEFGPGPGDMALHTQSLEPKIYYLVDGNSTSIKAIEEKCIKGLLDKSKINLFYDDLHYFKCDKKFDLIICEGMLPSQPDIHRSLKALTSFAAPNAVLILTHMTNTSYFSEICRRTLKPFFENSINKEESFENYFADIFIKDLNSLGEVSRSSLDWVRDTILHPYKNLSFSISDAIDIIGEDFEFLSSSPQLFSDINWHKAYANHDLQVNNEARQQIRNKEIYLLDCRIKTIDLSKDFTEVLELIDEATRIHFDIYDGNFKDIDKFMNLIHKISKLLKPISPLTSLALSDYVVGFKKLLQGNLSYNFGSFHSFWGRGQQYSSFQKK